jgi:hypothetical protein
MGLSSSFGLIAGLFVLLAYGIYFKQILKGQSKPNPSTWGIWLLAGLINTITHFAITEDIWQSLITFAATFSLLIIFGYSLLKGKFSKVSRIEVVTFFLAIVIAIFWQITSNERISNLILQSIYVLSFVPTVNGLVVKKVKEHYFAWVIASVSYVFALISLLGAAQSDWIAYINILIGILGNGLVALIIIRINKTK